VIKVNIEQTIKTFPKRDPGAHKGDFGHVLVIAGSAGYTGAAYLASQAAILSGSGLVTLAIGRSLYQIMAVKLTEVMVKPFFETKDFSLSLLAEKELVAFSERCSAVVIGPGISLNKETQHLVRNLLAKLDRPVVLDADGITACASHLDVIKNSKSKLIITPHAGEMARLTGVDAAAVEAQRIDVAIRFASEYNVVLALKGHDTVVAAPGEELYINRTGNPGMATGGTGDVLSGMIAGFAAQGIAPMSAAVLGTYFHGLAGDIALRQKGALSLVATDLLHNLPEALKTLG
jgi:NAD(P)H-hydrate epimerase